MRSLAAIVLLAFAAVAVAQEERFEDTSQIVAVEVPVNVVGRDGQPVRGLTAADFEVFDEGKKQEVTGFEVIDLEVLQPDGAAPQTPAPAAPAAPAAAELDGTARRHFLLLFDLSFSTPASVLKARLAARDFLLTSLHPSDLAAVVTFSVDFGPRLVVTFTPDRAQLARAIDTLGVRHLTDQQAQRVDPLRFVIEEPLTSSLLRGERGGGGGQDGELGSAVAQAERALFEHLNAISKAADKSQKAFDRSRIKAFTRSMAEMARTLDSVKGRKHLIYFSEGFDSRLMVGRDPIGKEFEEENLDIQLGRHQLVDSDNRYGNTEIQTAVNDMLESFRRADCVIQAVDIGGLRAGGDLSELGRTHGQDSLFYMANETGGEIFKDANNLRRQLERVLERTSVTYLLTFQRSDLKTDGAYHRLRVKAKLPQGARLSHRAGYYAPRPFQDLDPLEKALLASEGIAAAVPRRDVDLDLLVAPFRAGEGVAYVPVIIEVGGRSLLAGHAGDKLNVELYAYVSDHEGRMRDFFTQVVGLEMGKGRQAMEATGLKYYGHLDLPAGQYRVRVLVRNSDTGKAGVATAALTVPAWDQPQPVLLPPLFFEAPGSWVLVREPQGAGQQASVVYPFTVNGQPYVPSAKPALDGDAKARLCLVAYNLGKGEVKLDGQVLGPDGQPLPGGSLSLLERTVTGIEGVDKLLAVFEPKGLPAGDYVLRVAVTDPATGSRKTNSVPFVVN